MNRKIFCILKRDDSSSKYYLDSQEPLTHTEATEKLHSNNSGIVTLGLFLSADKTIQELNSKIDAALIRDKDHLNRKDTEHRRERDHLISRPYEPIDSPYDFQNRPINAASTIEQAEIMIRNILLGLIKDKDGKREDRKIEVFVGHENYEVEITLTPRDNK